METESQLVRPAAAGFVYALLVFAVGSALGTIRVLALVPRAGPTLAVLLETPVMLAASWWVSRTCVARLRVSCAVTARLIMGLAAFVVLMLAEVALARALFGRTLAEYLASLITVPGAIGLAAQVAFAGFPLAQAGRMRPKRGRRPSAER